MLPGENLALGGVSWDWAVQAALPSLPPTQQSGFCSGCVCQQIWMSPRCHYPMCPLSSVL